MGESSIEEKSVLCFLSSPSNLYSPFYVWVTNDCIHSLALGWNYELTEWGLLFLSLLFSFFIRFSTLVYLTFCCFILLNFLLQMMLLTDPEIESSLLISSDEGATYQKYRLNFYIQSLLFHPKQEDWILAYSQDQKVGMSSWFETVVYGLAKWIVVNHAVLVLNDHFILCSGMSSLLVGWGLCLERGYLLAGTSQTFETACKRKSRHHRRYCRGTMSFTRR